MTQPRDTTGRIRTPLSVPTPPSECPPSGSPSGGCPLPKHWLEWPSPWEAPADSELSIPACLHAHISPRPPRILLVHLESEWPLFPPLAGDILEGWTLGVNHLCTLRVSYSRVQSDAPKNLSSERRDMSGRALGLASITQSQARASTDSI